MKTTKAALAFFLFSAEAFCPLTTFHPQKAHWQLHGTSRPDTAEAVKEALRISNEFGPTSKEAKVAWDAVEEMDSNDSSVAYATEVIKASDKVDYFNKVHALAFLMETTKEQISQMRQLASKLKDLEIADPSLTKLGPEAEKLRKALSEAKAAAEVHGPHSAEADAAWDALEACVGEDECNVDSSFRYSAAALRAHHTYDAVVDVALLNEAIDAFDVIEELGRFVKVEKERLDDIQGAK